jgi:hypothetical protein
MHPEPLPIGELSATPWSFSPAWFIALALLLPAVAWLAFAWRHAFAQDPNSFRRAGLKELRRVLRNVRRSDAALRPWHLHAWLRATAKTWGVRVSAPTGGQVSQAMQMLTGDASVIAKWRELWSAAERGLFAANASPHQDWLERASSAAEAVQMPQRERRFPNRIGDWLPSTAVVVVIAMACIVPAAVHANLDTPAPSADTLQQLQNARKPSREALQANWSDWAAHHNLAAILMQTGEWHAAVAHSAVSFVLNPSSAPTRDNLRFALQQTDMADPNLQRLLSGMGYQRIPAWLSAAGWQRMALGAALLLAAGLVTIVSTMYLPVRPQTGSLHQLPLPNMGIRNDREAMGHVAVIARFAVALGALLLLAAIVSWNAYGPLNQPSAAILTRAVNLSPAPTDLVPEAETSPVAAGTIVLRRRSFLGWQQIAINENVSGWVRRQAVMPFYTMDSSDSSRKDRTS